MRSLSILAALASVSLSLPLAPTVDRGIAADRVEVADAPPPVTITSVSPEWTQQVEWALDRFAESGLHLPPITIGVHDSKAPCHGNGGLYVPGPPAELHLCSASTPGSGAARLITLHELAHAWAESQLSPEQKTSFLQLRGLDSWADPTHPPHEWGAEHAAEVVSWGLMEDMGPIVRIYDAQPPKLLVAFLLLTADLPLWLTTQATGVPTP